MGGEGKIFDVILKKKYMVKKKEMKKKKSITEQSYMSSHVCLLYRLKSNSDSHHTTTRVPNRHTHVNGFITEGM